MRQLAWTPKALRRSIDYSNRILFEFTKDLELALQEEQALVY